MEYARKLVYNGNIVDVEDIVCPGTELAHLSVGNLKKRMNEFAKILNDFGTKLKLIEKNINDEFDVTKATIEKNAKSYETIVTTRLNSEKTKYDALYNHATELIATTTNDFDELNVKYSQLDEDVKEIKESIEEHLESIGHNVITDATLADQIINLKKQFNIVKSWIASLYQFAIKDIDEAKLKEFNGKEENTLKTYEETELKYDEIANITEEWNEYLSEFHPNNEENE